MNTPALKSKCVRTIRAYRKAVLMLTLATSFEVSAASFDCEKTTTKIEKLICADATLSKLDDDLNADYRTILTDKNLAESAKNTQKQWLKLRNRCPNAACLQRAYETRLDTLAGLWSGSAPMVGDPTSPYDEGVRFTCNGNVIDIHLAKFSAASEIDVNGPLNGEEVPWQQSYKEVGIAERAHLESLSPVTRQCFLKGGEYILSFAAFIGGDLRSVLPTITIFHQGKVILPTTVLGICGLRGARDPVLSTGECYKDWAVGVFLFDSVNTHESAGNPVGIKRTINVHRIVSEFL